MTVCTGCGHDDRVPATEQPPVASRCRNCGDWPCETCGGINNLATGLSCPCWLSFEGMALADIKAVFAADGTFSIDPVAGDGS